MIVLYSFEEYCERLVEEGRSLFFKEDVPIVSIDGTTFKITSHWSFSLKEILSPGMDSSCIKRHMYDIYFTYVKEHLGFGKEVVV